MRRWGRLTKVVVATTLIFLVISLLSFGFSIYNGLLRYLSCFVIRKIFFLQSDLTRAGKNTVPAIGS